MLVILTTNTACDITLLMISLSLYITLNVFHGSKVLYTSQSNLLTATFPYVHFSLTTSPQDWHSSICWHSRIRPLDASTSLLTHSDNCSNTKCSIYHPTKGLPCSPIMCRTFFTRDYIRRRFYGHDSKKEMVLRENSPWRSINLSLMKITATDSKSKKGTLDTHVTYLINSCQGKIAGFFFLTKKINASICSGIECDSSLMVIGTIFNPATINVVPCMFTATLSLGLRVDDWRFSIY